MRSVLALGAILASLMLPSAAIAVGGHYMDDPGHATYMPLKASDGYRVKVSANDHRLVTVKVRKGGSSTEYMVRGVRNGKYGVSARFPGFGQVRFRFIPNGHQRRVPPPPWCEGPAGFLREGVVRGRIRFTGEEGYTRVAVRRAKAMVETWPRRRCRYLEVKEGRSHKFTATFDAFRETPPNISFSVMRYARHLRPISRRVAFEAYVGAGRGPVHILRSVRVPADASSIVPLGPKGAPENVMFAPPPPFSGTGTFQRNAESVFTWDGDLSVKFLGAAPMSLTGPAFNTSYCALRGCATQNSLEELDLP